MASAPTELLGRFRRLARRLGRTGWILHGTIHPRRIPAPGGRGGAWRRVYGPYYQWTFKQAGKTVTINLSAAQVKLFQRAIEAQRQLERLLAQMRSLSREYLQATTPGVRKRKRRP